jgi:hypothetical protein
VTFAFLSTSCASASCSGSSSPPLALLDINPGIASITRGILTPYSPVQWILTGFTVVLPGWFALLAARIVCSYGPERETGSRLVQPPPTNNLQRNLIPAMRYEGDNR